MEPDFRCEASSALATTIGLQLLSRIGADESEPMVQKAIQYVLNTFDEEKMDGKLSRRKWRTHHEPSGGIMAVIGLGEIQVLK
ncbi:hypothetical protein QNH10_04930 [Sporosarcina thermotolerans]|uniref:hypothetical protein n=1 Tax=Sporosarcina thermotolerans TaxID=633404 RepID=UPI0024BD4D89|nr:hypothetical protein [Sporosarcina thermotolerans]WHT49031.1 hypothetical protein QNH10_04930 [Sporosarcina thermotolerans]